MEGDALPRLQPRVDVVTLAASGGESASSARRATKLSLVRASLPKSAGAATSSQRRRMGSSSGATGAYGRSTVRTHAADPSTDGCDSTAVAFMQRQLTTPPTVVRPSSTRTGTTPRKSTTREQQPANDPQSEQLQQSQWHAMLHENEQLRLEMSRLQQQLVENMRGHAKILVGGGQFRASAASSSLPNKQQQPAPSSGHTCSFCVSLRASVKKARDGFDEARDVMAYRIVELERAEGEARTSLNQQSEELELLRGEVTRLREAEGTARQESQGMQQHIESLKQELLVLQATIEEISKCDAAPRERPVNRGNGRTTMVDSATQGEDLVSRELEIKLIQSVKDGEEAHRRLCELQAAHTELQSSSTALQNELSKATNDLQRALALHGKAESQWQMRWSTSEERCGALSRQCEDYEAQLKSTSRVVTTLESQLGALQSQLQAITDENERISEEKTRRIEELEARELEYAALTSSLRCRVNDLEERQRNDTDDSSIMATQIQQLTQDKEALVNAFETKSFEVKQREQETAEVRALLSEAELQLRAAEQAWASAKQDADNAAARLAAAEAETVAHGDTLRRLRKSHAAALEKAMQLVVRLCVVAPTVHVHLNTGSGANTPASSSSSSLNCKATLPQAQLRRVVEQEVLPLFATVFVQQHEGTSPQGTPMDPWLQSLLRDMQESLATHLQKLYATTSASSSSTASPPSINGL